MKKNVLIALFLCSFLVQFTAAQPKCYIEHYDLKDGLPQRSVMAILQDKKGFMWFATWDGLCRFDGYKFISYKNLSSDTIVMRSTRINKILQGKNGYIWVLCNNKQTYCFDPVSEKYIASFTRNQEPFRTKDILSTPSGNIWLISDSMGALHVQKQKQFNTQNSLLTTNNVRSVYEDHSGGSWLLTQTGLLFYDSQTAETKVFCTRPPNSASFFCAYETEHEIIYGADKGRLYTFLKKEKRFQLKNTRFRSNILSIQKIVADRLLVLTSNEGFFIMNNRQSVLQHYHTHSTPRLPSNKCISAYIDKQTNIWIETDRYDIARFDFAHNTISNYTAGPYDKENQINPPRHAIFEDGSGHLWIHPKGGGFCYYDREKELLVPFYNNPSQANWRFSDMLHASFVDRQGNIWLSTRTEGLDKVVFEQEVFRLNSMASLTQGLVPDEKVRAVFEDTSRRIWMGCGDGITRIFSANKEYLGYIGKEGSITRAGPPLYGSAYSFHQTKDGDMWIATKGNGIYCLRSTADKNRFTITNYTYNPRDAYSLSSNYVYTIYEDKYRRLWIGTYDGGLSLWDPVTGKFLNLQNTFTNYPKFGTHIRHINGDGYGNIYIGTNSGLIVFKEEFQHPAQISFKTYTTLHTNPRISQSNDVLNIFTDSAGETYISSYGSGLYKVRTRDEYGYPKDFTCYDKNHGLPSDVVLSVIEDAHKKLWVATEGCLSKYNPENETFEIFSDVIRLLHTNCISEATPELLHTGELVFGCLRGVLNFQPADITPNHYIPPLALTHLYVLGKKINIDNRISDLQEIHLKHNESSFNIEYVALDYAAPFNIQYSYQLEGVDKDWVYNHRQRTVNYSKIPPGTYTFKVRSTNSDGNWVNNTQQIRIMIHPSFWQTDWAYMLYCLLAGGVLFFVFYAILLLYRMRLAREQTELKTRFFTDISHEIRTPLSMIVSPVENILEEETLSPPVRSQLSLVLKNAHRMLQMVNQILDFRKIQKQRLKLQPVALGKYTAHICSSFFSAIKEKDIHLSVSNLVGDATVWGDVNQLEKLLFNLLSNAVKYSYPHQSIEVKIFRKESTLALQVKDEGTGMSKATLSKLFTRYESFNTNKSQPSTGIGLSIVKEVVDKHHARITVESEEGKGTIFTVYFPTGKEVFKQDNRVEFIQAESPEEGNHENTSSHPDRVEEAKEKGSRRMTLLIIEDDPDLRSFIRSILSAEYRILEAEDGLQGYKLATERVPDFILSDIMLPGMDGMELLGNLRNHAYTSHIPVILLTAKTQLDDRLKGIELGAHDYLTKPFNVQLLKAKIRTIIKQQQRYYNYISTGALPVSGTNSQSEEGPKIHPQDEKFLLGIQKAIEDNLDNGDFTVENLVATTIFSRNVFFKKLKSLTGLAPVEFIREERLKRAAALLREGLYVKEAAYTVGFSDIKYFTKCFKRTYGVSPTRYKETHCKR